MTARAIPTLSDRCHWYQDQDGAFIMIPGCIGCAVNGPDGCTCDVPESAIEQARRGRQVAESEVERLRKRLGSQHDRFQDLWDQNRRFRDRIRALEAAAP